MAFAMLSRLRENNISLRVFEFVARGYKITEWMIFDHSNLAGFGKTASC
jgi:hypothetical protein